MSRRSLRRTLLARRHSRASLKAVEPIKTPRAVRVPGAFTLSCNIEINDDELDTDNGSPYVNPIFRAPFEFNAPSSDDIAERMRIVSERLSYGQSSARTHRSDTVSVDQLRSSMEDAINEHLANNGPVENTPRGRSYIESLIRDELDRHQRQHENEVTRARVSGAVYGQLYGSAR